MNRLNRFLAIGLNGIIAVDEKDNINVELPDFVFHPIVVV
jgi:hypothetical protein